MGVPSEAFLAGDVYIDFPYEEVMFRFDKATGKVFRKFYGEPAEREIEQGNKLFSEARIAGQQTTEAAYQSGRARGAAR